MMRITKIRELTVSLVMVIIDGIMFWVCFLVRHKVKDLVEFVQNDGRIRDERKKAKATRDKYVGMSNEASAYRYSKSDL